MPNQLVRFLTVCFALETCLAFARTKPSIAEDYVTGDLAWYALVYPADDFTRGDVLRLSQEYVSRYKNLRLVRVGIYTDAETAHASRGRGVTDITYGWWREEFEACRRRQPLRAAELLRSPLGTTLRIRHPDGRTEEIDIAGKNSFHPVLNGVTVKLAHLSVARKGFAGKRRLIPIFHLTVPKEIALEEAGVLAKSMFDVLGVSNAQILIREDEWFIFDPSYPVLNPFAFAQGPPTPEVVARSPEFLCEAGEKRGCYQVSVAAR